MKLARLMGAIGMVLLMSAATARAASPAETLHVLLRDYDGYFDRADPIGAGQRGDAAAASLWPDDSPAAVAGRHKELLAFRDRLAQIPAEDLAGEDALNRDLLAWWLDIDIAGDAFDEERQPFSSDEGFFHTPRYAAEDTRIRKPADAEAWLTRLDTLPAYYATEIANMRRGLATGFVSPKITARAVAKAARAMADLPAAESPLLAPIQTLPADFPDAAALETRALKLVETRVKPAERQLAEFFEREYLPKARETIGAASLPDGAAYYAYRVRRETTTDLTPDQIFTLGEAEIQRIRKAMDGEIAASGFKGSFKEFQAFLRSDPQFYVTTREALLEKASRLAKRVDDKLPAFFGRLPRLTYGVRPVPAEIEEGYTSGRYFPGSPQQGIAGGLMINTSHLDQRPLYELPSLVAHEGVPGHHIQIALAQEQTDVPLFRREGGITAFVEGWALYSEQLVSEMGLYQTPYERFGMLSMEMWRACRLVIDTGIHAKGWTREQAVACLKDNSALADKNIQNEVDRYIAWPGQALGYKIGQIEITKLRDQARSALGPRFDYRRFHDAVLDEGPMPMDLLAGRIDRWIAAETAGQTR
jgi:uncharacterized protein (DUF885 family)